MVKEQIMTKVERKISPNEKSDLAVLSIIPATRFPLLNSFSFWSFVAVIFTVAWGLLALNGVRISHEHGPMENAQAWFLLIGCCLFVTLAAKMNIRNYRILFATLGLFYLSFFLREVEVEDLNIPYILILIGSGVGKKYLLATCWLIALSFFFFHTTPTWLAFKQWFSTFAGLTIALGGIFYLLGMPFDKKVFDLDYEMNVLAEEILESIATFWMFISALVSTLYFRVAAPRD